MDRIDVLGDRNYRSSVFTKDLLAETDDAELQEIVKNAAAELHTPIALVSLVLDQIQFFKAHVGLPDVLAAAKGTHRDASFCQFVVRDGKTFEVNDGPNDPRIPQHVVKEFNIQSYLGVPIKINGLVVGSLCVLDTKKRGFSEKEHQSLKDLGELVNQRLEAITKNRREARLNLTYVTLHPALNEISNALRPIQGHINLGYSYIASVRSYLDLSEHLISDRTPQLETEKGALEAAIEASQMIESHLLEIEMNLLHSMDCLKALNNLVANVAGVRLSEILESAQDISRNAIKLVGGFPLPDLLSDPIIHVKGDLAIALVSNCLLMIASALRKEESNEGIQLHINEHSDLVELIFLSKDLDKEAVEMVADQLNLLIGSKHPAVSLNTLGARLRLIFKVVQEEGSGNLKSDV